MNWNKAKLNRLLNDPKYRGKRIFDAFIGFLIVVSTAILFQESFGPEGAELPPWEVNLDRGILVLFLVEYLARLWVADPKLPKVLEVTPWHRFVLHFRARLSWMLTPLALIDLLALLPLFAFDSTLRLLRVARIFRLLRLYRVFVYHDPFHKLSNAFRANALLYLVASSLVLVTVLLGSVSFFVVEGKVNSSVENPWDAVWWTVVTLTTVGYGDTVPVTAAGRVVAIVLMISGMVLVAVFAGVMSQTLVGYLLDVREERIRMSSTVNHVIICGWNSRGPMIVEELHCLEPDCEVVIFSSDREPQGLPPGAVHVPGDPTKEAELDKVRMGLATSVIVLATHGEALAASDGLTALIVYTVRSFEEKLKDRLKRSVPLHVTAELMDPENYNHLKTAGADEVIHTAQAGSNLVAHSSIRPGMGRVFSELLSWWGALIDVTEVPKELDTPVSFDEVSQHLRKHQQFLPIGIVKADGSVNLNPKVGALVHRDDRLVFIRQGGRKEDQSEKLESK